MRWLKWLWAALTGYEQQIMRARIEAYREGFEVAEEAAFEAGKQIGYKVGFETGQKIERLTIESDIQQAIKVEKKKVLPTVEVAGEVYYRREVCDDCDH